MNFVLSLCGITSLINTMKMRKFSLAFLAIFPLLLTGCSSDRLTQYVNLKIGTGGHGHVFVGANVPFGAVQLGPTSIPQSWDWCSGYHDSDSTVIGFSHTHLSGTGVGDLFDITVMPVTEPLGSEGKPGLTFGRGEESDPKSGQWSYSDRTCEVARPGYYSTHLMRYDVKAELTATSRVGMHRYTFPASENAGIVFDLLNGGCYDRLTEAHIEIVDPQTGGALQGGGKGTAVRGYRFSRGWARDQRVYFYAEFSKPFESLTVADEKQFAYAAFRTEKGEEVLLKVALSSVSMEGAYANMKAEHPGWDFDATVEAADKAWNEELSKITVETDDPRSKTIFYTALYHSMIAPSEFCDVDGSYRGADGNNHSNPGYKVYTTFSLWDTYRAAMPLYSIFQKERYTDMIRTMISIYQEQGKLPVWHLHGCETNCMVGNPGIIPVADAIVKGYDRIDTELAFESMTASALRPDRGQDLRMKYGYIPCDLFNESVAYELEYALADGALANAAEYLAQQDPQNEEYRKTADYFTERSRSYRHLFDPQLGFIRGKDSKGNFREEYSPFLSSHRNDDYCEGNGWQYTWLVPHDFKGLEQCFSERRILLDKLDSLFLVSSVLEGEEISPDISGLIGQYAHGNEPSHHTLYLYSMAGQPWKTADRVREVLTTLYSDKPDGLSGNEDVGQMSSWYILSSLGFYQVEPASARYWFGCPVFDEAEIKVDGGVFRIKTENNSPENRYIQSVTLNGKAYTEGYLEHKDIAAGGELVFRMGTEPKIWYCPDINSK